MELKKNCCPRRRWGKTGLNIPVIPFGTQGFGNNFGPVSDEEAAMGAHPAGVISPPPRQTDRLLGGTSVS